MTVSQLNASLRKIESQLSQRIIKTELKVETVDKKVTELVETTEERRELDLYAFADQSERSDYSSNLMKNNCVLLTGGLPHISIIIFKLLILTFI